MSNKGLTLVMWQRQRQPGDPRTYISRFSNNVWFIPLPHTKRTVADEFKTSKL